MPKALLLLAIPALLAAQSLPRIVRQGGRYQFLVDGKPFPTPGAQAHNSSGCSSTTGKS